MSTLYIYGVDLGTSRSEIGYFKKRGIEIISDITQNKAIPSVAFLKKKNEWVFGTLAKKMAVTCPERYIYDTKRMLGHKFNDQEIVEIRDTWQFKTFGEDKTNKIKISIDIDGETVEYYPYEISGLILKNLVDSANKRSTIKTNKIVVTIPATFTKEQTDELNKAAEYVGLQIVRFINEPIAASIAYEFMNYDDDDDIKTNKKILIFDLGAGTLDISFIQNNNDSYNLLAYGGDKFLGGRDWDDCLCKYAIKEMKNKYQNIEFPTKIIEKIHQKCEEAKIALSSSTSFEIIIENDDDEQNDMKLSITRDKFYEISNELFERCIRPIEKVLKSSNFDKKDINCLILVGGSTRIPKIRDLLLRYINDDIDPYQGIDPEEAVAYGACIVASQISLQDMINKESQTQDHNKYDDSNEIMINKSNNLSVCNISIGIKYKKEGYDILIPSNSQIPCKVVKNYWTNMIFTQSNDIPLYANLGTEYEDMIDILSLPYEDIKNIPFDSTIQIRIEIFKDKIMKVEIGTAEGEIKKEIKLIAHMENFIQMQNNKEQLIPNNQYLYTQCSYEQSFELYQNPNSNYNYMPYYNNNYSQQSYISNNYSQQNIAYPIYYQSQNYYYSQQFTKQNDYNLQQYTNQNDYYSHQYTSQNIYYSHPYQNTSFNNQHIHSNVKINKQMLNINQNDKYSSCRKSCNNVQLSLNTKNNSFDNHIYQKNDSYIHQSQYNIKNEDKKTEKIYINQSEKMTKSTKTNLHKIMEPDDNDKTSFENKKIEKTRKSKDKYIKQQDLNDTFKNDEDTKKIKKSNCLIC